MTETGPNTDTQTPDDARRVLWFIWQAEKLYSLKSDDGSVPHFDGGASIGWYVHTDNQTDVYMAVGDLQGRTHPFHFELPDSGALIMRGRQELDDESGQVVKIYAAGAWDVVTTTVASDDWPGGGFKPDVDDV